MPRIKDKGRGGEKRFGIKRTQASIDKQKASYAASCAAGKVLLIRRRT